MADKIAQRGFVLVRSGGRVSAIVQRAQAEGMHRRFGGRLVRVKGMAYREVRGSRVLVDPSAVVEA